MQEAFRLYKERFSPPYPLHTLDVPRGERVNLKDGKLNLSRRLENDFIDYKTGLVKEKEILANAEDLPKKIDNLDEWKKQFSKDNDGKHYVDTPIGKVYIDPQKSFGHLKINTNLELRDDISGAFIRVMQDPLFVVKQPYTPSVASRYKQSRGFPSHSKSPKANVGNMDNEIIQQSYVFYKPFKDGGNNWVYFMRN